SKALGIKMGAPYFMYEQFFKEKGIEVFSSNYTLYGDMSGRVIRRLSAFSPDIEVYSIDEAFLDLSHMPGIRYFDYGRTIRQAIAHDIGLPVCVGMAPSKTLAKSANHYAKKTQASGVFCIDSDASREEVLRWQPVDDVWGIGRQYATWLTNAGITDAWQLSQANKEWIGKKMGVVGVRLVNELNGISCIPLEEAPPAKKAICTSRSFGNNLTDKDEIRHSVAAHITRCAEKLRQQKTCTAAVQVFINTNIWNQNQKQYHRQVTIPLLTATNNTAELMKYGMMAFENIFKEGIVYKKTGVTVMDLVPETAVQRSLFDPVSDRPKNARLMQALDGINRKHGQDTVRMSSLGYSAIWKLKIEHKSPCYTTRIADILKVKN
ncbi:MAG: Y-family DNA polymerase, partial [Sphingobacteriales bacterium]